MTATDSNIVKLLDSPHVENIQLAVTMLRGMGLTKQYPKAVVCEYLFTKPVWGRKLGELCNRFGCCGKIVIAPNTTNYFYIDNVKTGFCEVCQINGGMLFANSYKSNDRNWLWYMQKLKSNLPDMYG